MGNNFKYDCELMKQNKNLEERLNCARGSLRRAYWREAYYGENKYKKAIEEMVEILDKFSGMSTCFKFNELCKILNEVIKDEHMD